MIVIFLIVFLVSVSVPSTQCANIVISIIAFGHPITSQQSFGLFIVFICLFWAGNIELSLKESKQQPQKEAPKEEKEEKETNDAEKEKESS